MAREDRLIHERIDSGRLPYPMASTNHVVHIKDTMINALRDVFSRDTDFTYIQDPNGVLPDFNNPRLGIVITDVFQYEVEFLPAITIRINSGNLKPISFNQNEFTYDYQVDENGSYVRDALGRPIPIYKEYSGLYDTSVTVNIHTWDPLTRETLITRVAFLFQHLLRDQLYADAGLFVKSVDVGGETETPHNNEHIYSQSLTLGVLTQWTNKIPVGENVMGINLQIIGDGVSPSEPGKSIPSKQDLKESDRVDWVTEIRDCPELVLSDALYYDDTRNDFFVTEDWIEVITTNAGVTISDAILQINSDSSLKDKLIPIVDSYRQKATNARNSLSRIFPSGNPHNLRYRLNDGTFVFADSTVLFINNIKVLPSNTVELNSGITISSINEILIPDNENEGAVGNDLVYYKDLERWVNPFTSTDLADLDVWNFLLILLYCDSIIRQSQWSLNKIVEDYLGELIEQDHIDRISIIKNDLESLAKYKFLHGQITHLNFME